MSTINIILQNRWTHQSVIWYVLQLAYQNFCPILRKTLFSHIFSNRGQARKNYPKVQRGDDEREWKFVLIVLQAKLSSSRPCYCSRPNFAAGAADISRPELFATLLRIITICFSAVIITAHWMHQKMKWKTRQRPF